MILARAVYRERCFECLIKDTRNQELYLHDIPILIENGFLKENEYIRFDKENKISFNTKIQAFDKCIFEPLFLIFYEMDHLFLTAVKYGYNQKVTIGNSTDADILVESHIEEIKITIRSSKEENLVSNVNNCSEVFLDGHLFSSRKAGLFSCISFERYRIFILNHMICIFGPVILNKKSEKLMFHPLRKIKKDAFRSSRIFLEELKEENLIIEAPRKINIAERESSIIEFSPLILVLALICINLSDHYEKNLSMWIYPIAMLISMFVLPMIQKRLKRGHELRKKKEYENLYLDYLNQINQKMEGIKNHHKEFLERSYPNAKDCMEMFKESKEGWNRSALVDVFVRIGKGTIDSHLKISYEAVRHDQKNDPLFMAYEYCCKSSLEISDAPILCGLNKEMNVIANKEEQIIFAQDLILQLVMSYDPNTLQLVLVCDLKQVEDFEFIYYCQHFWHVDSFRFILCDPIQIQEGIYHLKKIQGKRKIVFILNESDFWYKDVSAIRFVQQRTEISKNADHILDLQKNQSWRENQRSSFQKELFKIKDLKEIQRFLSKASLAASHDFELPDETDLFSLNPVLRNSASILQQWSRNEIEESLIIPLGMKEKSQPLYFDIHERYHGPHGLIAGMTGSGKTQLLLEMILNYASYYPCDLLNILLFDFKGGDLSAALVNDRFVLPHVSGVLTNLNQEEIERVKKSLEHELITRQNLMNEAKQILKQGSMNIYDYQKAYKAHKLKKQCSHLLLIVDEFAELKSQIPSFMDYLIKIARIGRSLGIHLILATQKPAGIVNDQIWSNSKFKICMKVQSSHDSFEMIKSDRAALIKNAGRFILETGYGEELMEAQAPYIYADEYRNEKTLKLKILNLQGQVKIEKVAEKREGKTQFDVAIKNVCDAHKITRIKPKMCWHDPLPSSLKVDRDIPMMLAKLDDPEFQRILPFCVDCRKGILVYASETSTLIYTLLWQILKWTKKQVLLISGNDKTQKMLKDSNLAVLDVRDRENIDATLRLVENKTGDYYLVFEACDELMQDSVFKKRILSLKRNLESCDSSLLISISSLKNCSYGFIKEFDTKIMMDHFDKTEIYQFFEKNCMIKPSAQNDRALILYKERILEGQICFIDEKIK